MNHDDAIHRPDAFDPDTLLAGHALGDLEEGERAQLTVLLRERPELRERLEEFSTTLELLPLALPATASPPPRLRERLVMPARQPNRQPLASLRRWLVPVLLTGGLVLVGAELHQTRRQLALVQHRLQATGAIPSVSRRLPLRSVATGGRPSGEVLITGNQSHNLLMLDDLPPLPPHHTYRLWATVAGRKVGCVPFVPNAQGQVAMPIPLSPTSQATSVSVSLESDPSGNAPHGPMVLASSI